MKTNLQNFLISVFLVTLTVFFIAVSGCSNKGKGGQFRVNGLLSGNINPSAASSLAGEVITSADYVYAAKNSRLGMREVWRTKSYINEDNSFQIDLTQSDAWILAFIDSSKSGQEMLQGIFKASSLDTITPISSTASASTNVGDILISADGRANIESDKYTTFIGDLGMTLIEAEAYGAVDDLSLRYINPDIDGNGVLDMDDSSMPSFKLEFTSMYEFGSISYIDYIRNGDSLPSNINAFLDDSWGGYANSINLRVEKKIGSFFSTMPGKFELSWTDNGNYLGSNPMSSELIHLVDNPVEGIEEYYFSMDFDKTVTDIPDGTLTFKFYALSSDLLPAETWKFSHVKTNDDASNRQDLVFPFPIFNIDVNGDVSYIRYKWMKKVGEIFVEATSSDIELLVGKNSVNIGWSQIDCGDGTCYSSVEWKPYSSGFAVEGTFSKNDVRTGENVTNNRRSDITGVTLMVNDNLGTRLFLRIH